MFNRFLSLCVVVMCITQLGQSQNICQNCVNSVNSTYNFTCNNIACSGFTIPYTSQYLFNASAVMCNQPNGSNGGSNCFYLQTINSDQVTYIFCNASITNCASCLNQNICNTCFNGYYLYVINSSVMNCQACSGAIAGCLYCTNQTQCTQCLPGYVLYGGFCAYMNGTLPNGLGQFTYEKGGSTVAEIVAAVFIFCILLMMVIAVYIFFIKEKKKIPDFLNPQLSQPIEQTIAF